MRVVGGNGCGEGERWSPTGEDDEVEGDDDDDDEKAMASWRDWDGEEKEVVGDEKEGVGEADAKADSGVGVEILRPLRLGLRVWRDTNELLRVIIAGVLPLPEPPPLPFRPAD